MEIFFPAQTLPLVHVFAPCFTAPSFAYFQSSLWALMVVEGRKCLTRLACCAFFLQRDLSSWERFLAGHRWSVTAVTERLVTLVVERLGEQLKVHGASLVGKDTTLVAKSATRMLGSKSGKTTATTQTAAPLWWATTGIWQGSSAGGTRAGCVGPW